MNTWTAACGHGEWYAQYLYTREPKENMAAVHKWGLDLMNSMFIISCERSTCHLGDRFVVVFCLLRDHHPALLTHFSLLNQLSSGLEMIHSYQKGLHSFICRHVFWKKSLLQEFEDSVVVDLSNHVQEKASNKWKRREKRANIHTQILQIKIILQIHRWREGVYQNVTKDIYKVLIKLLHLCLA